MLVIILSSYQYCPLPLNCPTTKKHKKRKRCEFRSLSYLSPKDPECSTDDDDGRHDDVDEQRFRDHWIFDASWFLTDDILIDWLLTKTRQEKIIINNYLTSTIQEQVNTKH